MKIYLIFNAQHAPRNTPMLRRTDSDDPAFRTMVRLLDQELAVHNGDQNDFFVQFNKIDKIKHALVAEQQGLPVGIGALRAFDEESMEVKRMYVPRELRGKGIAAEVLAELETWAKELGYRYTILETATYLPAAVKLYERSGYERIPNYGQYVGVETSVCMRKDLDPGSWINSLFPLALLTELHVAERAATLNRLDDC